MTRVASGRSRPDRPTEKVVSAGGVLFDTRGRVLILKRADEGTWCFPKGHVEAGETLQQTAAREIREECGLECEIGRRIGEVRYGYYWPPEDVNYDKRVVYFLAYPVGGVVRLEDRFSDWRWAIRAEAVRLMRRRNDKEILRKAITVAGLSGKT
ncbi:MAG: NUDIX domain-containing protein [Methanobacteriota archaeon]|nr:MAG: NUDIX domain-containing protein [Euryarchaeota archaeon]